MVARLPYGPGADPSKLRPSLPRPPPPRYAPVPLQAKREAATAISHSPFLETSSSNISLPQDDVDPDLRQSIVEKWNHFSPETLEIFRQLCKRVDEPSSQVKPEKSLSGGGYITADTGSVRAGATRTTTRPSPVNTTVIKRKAPTTRESTSDEDSDGDPWSDNRNQQIRLRIADEAHVAHFLKMRFTQIQQLTTKVIAKAWIKAICPKKQANYPYVDSNPREDHTKRRRARKTTEKPRIPSFWPIDVCRHKEPDHTRKVERTNLLVHLLRLHWTEKEWLECNVGCEVPAKIQNRNWVGFLKDAFPIRKLDEVQGSNPDKANSRKTYLREIYKVAEDEQNFRNRMGDKNSSRSYAAGPGWVPFEGQTAREPYSSCRSRRTSRQSTSSSNDVQRNDSEPNSDSKSDSSDVSPNAEAHDTSGSASLVSDSDFVREAKVEDLVPIELSELQEANAPAQGWRSIQPVMPKIEAGEDRVTVSINGTPSAYVGDFYASGWNGGQSLQQSQDMYEQPLHCSSESSQWFDYSQPQQNPASSCSSSSVEPHDIWQYRSNMVSSASRPDSLALQGRMASPYANVNEVRNMSMSGPFAQMMVPTANNAQYEMPGMDCSTAAYGSHDSCGSFLPPRQQNMYERWS